MMIRINFDPEQARKIVRSVPLFAKFTDQELTAFLERTNVYAYRKDEIIIHAEKQVRQMFIVLKGRVKVVDLTDAGDERLMAIRHRGEYFGDMGFLDGKTDSAIVIAMEPCKVMLIPKNVFEEFLLEDKRTLMQIVAVLCGRLRESWIFHDIIGSKDAESKIRATLAHYSKTLGTRDDNGVIINSVLSQQAIADRVQIKRETVSRVMRRMKDQNEIEKVGRHYRLMPSFFEKYEQSRFSQ